jgi:hypothetical protein
MTKLKYGFLTTYDQTMFFKQDLHPLDPEQCVLYFSNVIRHTTAYQANNSTNFAQYHGKVSLRECFLYLANQIIAGDYGMDNPMSEHDWVPTRSVKSYKTAPENYSDSAVPTPIAGVQASRLPSGRQSRQPTTRMPVGRSRHEATLGPWTGAAHGSQPQDKSNRGARNAPP